MINEGWVMQLGETEPFICELLSTLTSIIHDLQLHQIHMFYEAVGLMIGMETNQEKREAYLVSAFPTALPNLLLVSADFPTKKTSSPRPPESLWMPMCHSTANFVS